MNRLILDILGQIDIKNIEARIRLNTPWHPRTQPGELGSWGETNKRAFLLLSP